MFDLEATQRQVSRGSGPEQQQAGRSIGLDQLATSPTRRLQGHDEAGNDSLLRLVVFDLGATQRKPERCSEPEQQQAGRSIGLDQLTTSSTRHRRGHDEAGHDSLLRLVVFGLGATQRKVDIDSEAEQLQAGRSIGLDHLANSSIWR